jgi:hypothetical protein
MKVRPLVVETAGHCCACSVVCWHIGPIQLCEVHRNETKERAQ